MGARLELPGERPAARIRRKRGGEIRAPPHYTETGGKDDGKARFETVPVLRKKGQL